MASTVPRRNVLRFFLAITAVATSLLAAYVSFDGLSIYQHERKDSLVVRNNRNFHEMVIPKSLIREAILSAIYVNTWYYENRNEDRRFLEYAIKDGLNDGLSVRKAVLLRFERTKSNLRNFAGSYCDVFKAIVPRQDCPSESVAELRVFIELIRPDFPTQKHIPLINKILEQLVDKLIGDDTQSIFLPSRLESTAIYRTLMSFVTRAKPREFKVIETPISSRRSVSFEIGATLVTQEEWYEVMGYNPSFFQLKKHCPESYILKNDVALCPHMPVESFAWQHLMVFFRRKNHLEDRYKYRLPTAEEWETAARAGGISDCFFGECDQTGEKYSWYLENAGLQTHDVATKLPNRFGLYDMTGNVWQVVDAPLDSVTTYVPGNKPMSSPGYMIRGGSWINRVRIQKISDTSKVFDDWTCYDVGFRLARDRN